MRGLKGERVLMRIHLEERDKYQGIALYEILLKLLRTRHYAGATVLRGKLGFGAGGHVHPRHAISLWEDAPIVIEVVDTEEKIQAILPEIERMVASGFVTLERVRVIMYRPNVTPTERTEDHTIDVTGSWRVVPPV